MKTTQKLLIIDAHALIHRAFHALPPLTTTDGEPINAVYGFFLILFKALKDIKPDYVAVAFDSKGKTIRHKTYAQYKGTRAPTAPELISQFPKVRELVEAFGYPCYSEPGYEADDLIGTICEQFEKTKGIETVILTGDFDLVQLVDHNTKVLKIQAGVKDLFAYDEEAVKAKHGLTPKQIIDYKGLRGDTSDNIPGVRGIGEKGATELLQKFGSIENIFKHIEEIQGRNRKALEGHEADAQLSKELATILHDAPITFDLEAAKIGAYNREKITDLFRKYAFTSLLAQLQSLPGFKNGEATDSDGSNKIHQTKKSVGKKGPHKKTSGPGLTTDSADNWLQAAERSQNKHDGRFKYTLVNTPEAITALAKDLAKQKVFAFDTETTGLNSVTAAIVGLSISWKDFEGYYVPCTNGVPKELVAVFENPKIHKTGHNTKFDIEVLHHAGVQIQGVVFDSMLASYLCNSSSRSHGLDNLAFVEYGHQMQPIEELIGKGKTQITMDKVPVEQVSWYASEDADFAWRLYNTFSARIDRLGFRKLLEEIEMPTMHALIPMEENGVYIDTDFLHAMSKDMHKQITALEKKIQKLAGVEFNVGSPVQLKDVLFNKLKISTQKVHKTKTGFSTAAAELEKLSGEHPIIDLIGEYRELSKLTSTYLDALPEMVDKETGRIHTSYNQTIAATGRLSSTDPNLQNIPIRTELGREIRKAFVPRRGHRMLSLDYSQIELRIVAHLSKDPMMVEAFQKGEDIHTRTAAALNETTADKVSKDMRRAAKAINFGILYGMGVQGIMRDAKVGRDEAREFLDKYFTVHKGIHEYIETIKESTKKLGYAETLFGRKRLLPEINSSNRMIAAGAERAAVNMPVQGTAADIMKLAMIAVQDAIQAGKIDALMILQVHDELVFEVAEKHLATEAKKIQKIMENIYTLDVPLEVNIQAGKNWGELKPIE